jgi:hypothetical protein
LSNPDVATITDVKLGGNPELRDIDYQNESGAVDIRAALAETDASDTIQLAVISVRTEDPGNTKLTLSDVAVGDLDGTPLNPTIANAEFAVTPDPKKALTVSLSNDTIKANSKTTGNVILRNAERSVGTYNITVTLPQSSVAELTDIKLGGNPKFSEVTYRNSNTSVTARAAVADTNQSDQITVLAFTLSGASPSTTPVELTSSRA